MSQNNGIYAIYRIYGSKETFIYIGKTTRSFLQRINEHYNDWLFAVRGQIRIRIEILTFPI
ncbi:GIY-YIG nuclease family protein [Neobacillus sp. KR4-4]|uniref:GIY-YIG nuclease family protein n=1 Tax=Neobacillus sp. KR4-4 TaxID=3344872 RepID=UPI0035CA6576